MGMRTFPTREDLAWYPKIFKWTVVSLAVLSFLAALAGIGFVFVPGIILDTAGGIVNDWGFNDLSTYFIVRDAVGLLSLPYYQPIVRLADLAESRPLVSSDLDSLAGMPEVVDAFYIDYDQGGGVVSKQALPVAKLMERLDLKGAGKAEGPTPHTSTDPYVLVERRHLSTDQGDYILLVRYFGTRFPRQATGVVGAVMDRHKTIAGMLGLLDSLLANSTYFRFRLNGMTMGLLDGRDTLWWHGDRNVEIKPLAKYVNRAKGKYWGIGGDIAGLDMKLLIKTELQRGWEKDLRMLPKLVLLLELLLVAALIALVIEIRIARGRKKAA